VKIYTLERETIVPVPVREAFAFFEDPYNLARITPPSLAFRITNTERVEMRRGAGITYQIRVAGVPLSWKTVIAEYDPPSLFVDEQAAGPYRFWRHTHTFRPTPAGTIVADRVDYALPFGWVGRMAHAVYVARQLRRIFDYRQQVLTDIFRGGSTER
jgi:ligand-binding SRPBCC domain-containing protein